MSSVKISGDPSGTGIFTISAPNTNSNFTLTLPQSTTTVVGTDATQTLTNKTLTSPTLTTPNVNSAQVDTVSGTAPLYFARAWVNFNGTGTVAIRASGNVSSITDITVGYYRVNFTIAMPDVNYTILNNASDDNTAATITCTSGTWGGTTQTTTSALIFVGVAGAGNDRTYVGVSIFR